MSLKGNFCLLLLAAWNLGSWSFLIQVPFDVSIARISIAMLLTVSIYSLSANTLIPLSSPRSMAACWLLLVSILFKRL